MTVLPMQRVLRCCLCAVFVSLHFFPLPFQLIEATNTRMLLLLLSFLFLPIIAVRMFLPDPVFLPLFPLTCILRRFKALLTPGFFLFPSFFLVYFHPFTGGFEMSTRLFLIFRNIMLVLNQPFIFLYWTIDDVVFSSYRSVEIVDPVFVVGG